MSLIFETSVKMKYILLNLLLFCTAIPIYSEKLIDCYLCSDFKESECFLKKEIDTISSHNKTHDSVVRWNRNWTIISTPCKGHKNDVVKCSSCLISYDLDCKICKYMLHIFKTYLQLSTNLKIHCSLVSKGSLQV